MVEIEMEVPTVLLVMEGIIPIDLVVDVVVTMVCLVVVMVVLQTIC